MDSHRPAGGAAAIFTEGSSLGPYRVDGTLAHGGMGVVYRATEVALDRPVALKVINPAIAWEPGFRGRFERESRFAASVDDPHIVPVYAAGDCDGVLYIAMRLVEGTDLRSLIVNEGPLPPARAVDIVVQIASALDAAHARGLVHRDVKPANVLITQHEGTDHVYLTDFGVTKSAGSVSSLTAAGHWAGTVDYVAPEQIRGESVGPATDVYSLGCVLYEALTGVVPFPRENDLAKLWAHGADPPPSASDEVVEVPAALAAVVQRAMSKRAEDRFPTAGELGTAALEAIRARGRSEPSLAPQRRSVPAASRTSRLPAPLTPTIGREGDRTAVAALVRRDGVRLVSLLGPGGVGKSRFAVELARALEDDFADGGWFVELAPLTSADQVAGAIAAALQVTPASGETAEQAVLRFLRPRQALVVLDNFEHVLSAAGLVRDLLSRCAGVKVIATSRAPLEIQPEHRFRVDPLVLPSGAGVGEVRRSPACELFVERARSRGAPLSVDAGNADAIASVCRRLDGLPLAIELAAARAPMLDPHELDERLQSALENLGTGTSDMPDRQRTLRATLDWSSFLLDPEEGEAFARFSVFAGGASLDAAQEVTGAGAEALEGLVDKHLVMRDAETRRLRMLATVREYAHERLALRPEADAVASCHCDHYLALAEQAEPHLYTHAEREWLGRLDTDADNLRAALEWSAAEGDSRRSLRLAGLLHAFWAISGRVGEGVELVRHAIDRAGDGAAIEDRAAAQRAYVHLLVADGAPYWKDGRDAAEADAHTAVDLSRQAGDPRGIADALLVLSSFAATESAPPRTRQRALADEALHHAREAGDDRLVAYALMTRAIALPGDEAGAEVDQAAAALTEVGDLRHLMWLYSNTAYNAMLEGVPDRARPLLDEALPLARELGYPLDLALACGNSGLEALFSGDLDRAQATFDEMLRICWDQVSWLAAEGLVGFAAIAARRRDHELAAQLIGAARAIGPLADDDVTVRLRREFFEPTRALMGDEWWQAAESQGARLSFDEAIALALDSQPTTAPTANPS